MALAALLWGGVEEDQSQQSLRRAVWDLRQALARAVPSPLSSDSDGVRLVPESVDALEFEARVRVRSPEALRQAVDLYKGDFLANLKVSEPGFDGWLTQQRERLQGMLVEALERLLAHEVAANRAEPATEVALRLLAVNPAHEVAHRNLIRLYARLGRRDAALRQYQACSKALWHTLRAKPEPETDSIYRQVLAGATAGGSAGATRALIVEDEIVTRALLEELLAGEGYDVVVAGDGAEALFHLSRATFDVVLADIWMPFLDGMKVLEVVREKLAGTPVILITGDKDPQLEAKCLSMGAVDYVTKPFHGPTLLARIRKATHASGAGPGP